MCQKAVLIKANNYLKKELKRAFLQIKSRIFNKGRKAENCEFQFMNYELQILGQATKDVLL